MGLLPPTGRVTPSAIAFQRHRSADALAAGPAAADRARRGDGVPGADLLAQPLLHHRLADRRGAAGARRVPRRQLRGRVLELLGQVGIPAPEQRMRAFPHQLSGGLNQRVMIAMAIACNPALLIADEPTTALDVTVQKGVLDLLVGLQRDRGMGLVLITHDMGVVAETAQRVQVMYAGQVMEEQPAAALFAPSAPSLHRRPAGRAAGTGGGQAAPADHPRRGARHRRPARRLPVRPALPLPHHALQLRAAGVAAAIGAKVRCHYPLDDAGQPHGLAHDACWRRRTSPGTTRRRGAQAAEGGGRRRLQPAAGQHAGGGGRVGLRQVHPGPALRADGAADRRRDRDRGQARRPTARCNCRTRWCSRTPTAR